MVETDNIADEISKMFDSRSDDNPTKSIPIPSNISTTKDDKKISKKRGRPAGIKTSPEAIERIREAAKKRWAEKKSKKRGRPAGKKNSS